MQPSRDCPVTPHTMPLGCPVLFCPALPGGAGACRCCHYTPQGLASTLGQAVSVQWCLSAHSDPRWDSQRVPFEKHATHSWFDVDPQNLCISLNSGTAWHALRARAALGLESCIGGDGRCVGGQRPHGIKPCLNSACVWPSGPALPYMALPASHLRPGGCRCAGCCPGPGRLCCSWRV